MLSLRRCGRCSEFWLRLCRARMKFCFWFDCGYQNGLSWQCCKSCQDYHESHAKERKDGRAISKLGDSDATSRIDCAERKQLPNRFAALCEGNYAPDEIEQAKKLTGRYTRIIYSSIDAARPNCGPLENRHCPPQRPCYIEARDCGRGLTEF